MSEFWLIFHSDADPETFAVPPLRTTREPGNRVYSPTLTAWWDKADWMAPDKPLCRPAWEQYVGEHTPWDLVYGGGVR